MDTSGDSETEESEVEDSKSEESEESESEETEDSESEDSEEKAKDTPEKALKDYKKKQRENKAVKRKINKRNPRQGQIKEEADKIFNYICEHIENDEEFCQKILNHIRETGEEKIVLVISKVAFNYRLFRPWWTPIKYYFDIPECESFSAYDLVFQFAGDKYKHVVSNSPFEDWVIKVKVNYLTKFTISLSKN